MVSLYMAQFPKGRLVQGESINQYKVTVPSTGDPWCKNCCAPDTDDDDDDDEDDEESIG